MLRSEPGGASSRPPPPWRSGRATSAAGARLDATSEHVCVGHAHAQKSAWLAPCHAFVVGAVGRLVRSIGDVHSQGGFLYSPGIPVAFATGLSIWAGVGTPLTHPVFYSLVSFCYLGICCACLSIPASAFERNHVYFLRRAEGENNSQVTLCPRTCEG